MFKFLTGVLALFLISSRAFSAEVIKINEKKGTIIINEGSSTGFSNGKHVCFFNGTKKIACGQIAKAASAKALVKIPLASASKIHTGYSVVMQDSGATVAANEAEGYNLQVAFKVHYLPTAPSSYNNLKYQAPTSKSTTLWALEKKSSSLTNPPAFGFEFELVKIGLLAGFRFGLFPSSSSSTRYDNSNSNLTITTKFKGTDVAFYVDWIFFKKWNLSVGAGLDIDTSSLTMTGTQTNSQDTDISNQLFAANSSLTVFSLRIPISYEYAIRSFGLSVGIVPILPLYATGPTQSITTPTSPIDLTLQSSGSVSPTTVVPDQDKDLSNAIDHKKSGLAYDLTVGLFYLF